MKTSTCGTYWCPPRKGESRSDSQISIAIGGPLDRREVEWLSGYDRLQVATGDVNVFYRKEVLSLPDENGHLRRVAILAFDGDNRKHGRIMLYEALQRLLLAYAGLV